MLAAGCQLEAGSAKRLDPKSSAESADQAVLQRWWAWNSTVRPQAPSQDPVRECAPDPSSDLWFAGTPITVGKESLTCTIPAGRRLVLVPATINTPEETPCVRGIAGDVPVSVTATLDGKAVGVSLDGPTKVEVRGQDGAVLGSNVCSYWAITPPMSLGQHQIVLETKIENQPPAHLYIDVRAT